MHVRTARPSEAPILATMLHEMVKAMESFGAPRVRRGGEILTHLEKQFGESLADDSRLLLLAEDDGGGAPIGMLEARVVMPHLVFEPEPYLHVAAVYVAPEKRRRGAARALVAEALDWGRQQGCVRAELNVLQGNPARNLYARLGFTETQVEMTLDLTCAAG